MRLFVLSWRHLGPNIPTASTLPVAQVTGFREHQCLQEVLYGCEHAALQQRRMDESEDPWQHRGADLSQRGRTGSGHAAQQGNGDLNTDMAHTQCSTAGLCNDMKN